MSGTRPGIHPCSSVGMTARRPSEHATSHSAVSSCAARRALRHVRLWSLATRSTRSPIRSTWRSTLSRNREYPLRSDRNRPSGMYLHVTGNCRCARGSNRRGFAACHPETQSGLSVRPIKAPKPTTSRELDRAGSSARHLSRASAPAPRQPAGLLHQSRLIRRSLRGQAPRSSSRAIYRAPRPMSASVRRTQCPAATRRNAHITRTLAYPRVVNL